MAKQSGIHQLRGKVGEMSYYRQTGVAVGLVRTINQAMSDRVKTGEEYANTRLNNTEFGAACNVAGLLGQMVQPKFRPMVLPFSQSKMAKEILRIARLHTQNWGQRVVTSDDTAKLCDILSSTSKRNISEFVSLGITRTSNVLAGLDYSITPDQSNLLLSLGVNRVTIKATQFDLATGQWSPLAQEMATGYFYQGSSALPLDGEEITPGASLIGTEDLDVDQFIPEANHSGHQIVVFVFLPMREINDTNYVLQEYCSFVAMPLPPSA